MPATTPPAIAPMLDADFGVGGGVGVVVFTGAVTLAREYVGVYGGRATLGLKTYLHKQE